MRRSLQILAESLAEGCRFRFKGDLDEYCDGAILALAKQARYPCWFNLKDVGRLNSTGIKNLVHVVRQICRGGKLIYEECPPEVVDTFNMVPDLVAEATVSSVLVPFSCRDCRVDRNQVVLLTERARPRQIASNCERCGAAMEPGIEITSYFAFLDAKAIASF